MWEYVKGSEAYFKSAPEWATLVCTGGEFTNDWFVESFEEESQRHHRIDCPNVIYNKLDYQKNVYKVIAERRKVDSLQSRVNDAKLQESIRIGSGVAPGVHSSPVYDTVQRPAHYNQSGIECIDAIAASMTPVEFQAYLKGNVQKYLWRYQHKNGVEDCRKAQWYLDRLVKELSK